MKKLTLLLPLVFLGCASFSTTQTDLSYDETGKPLRQVTTRATARTLGTSKSALTSFKAGQTDKTQTTSVGNLAQETSGTNAVAIMDRMVELAKSLPK